MYKPLFIIVLVIILTGLILPITYGLNTSSINDSNKYLDYHYWATITHKPEKLEKLINEVIPSNGSIHNDIAEYMFWNHVIPEKWGYGYYEKILYDKLIPRNTSSSYYYKTYFRDIIGYGFEAYYMGFTNVTPLVEPRVYSYYLDTLFGYLIPKNYSSGFYYDTVFYKLYYNSVWDYPRILANIAYNTPYGSYIAQILTRIDMMKWLDRFGNQTITGNSTPSLLDTNLTGTIRIKLVSIDGPVEYADVSLYRKTPCIYGSYCGVDYVASKFTDANGTVVFHVYAGTYQIVLDAKAYGVIDNVTLNPGEEKNITLMLGKTTITLYDADNYRMAWLSISIYQQRNTPEGPKPGYFIANTMLSDNGTLTAYFIEGTYMIRPHVYNLENPYISGIEAVAGVTRSYVFHLDVVKVTIKPHTPVPLDYSGLYPSIYISTQPYSWDYSVEISNGVGTIWVKPGDYFVYIPYIYFKGLSTRANILFPIHVAVGSTNTFYYDLGVLWWKPSNVNHESVMTLTVYSVKTINGTIYSTRLEGDVNIKWGDYLLLPPMKTYLFKPTMGLNSSKYNFTVYVTPTTNYEYTGNLPVGYLNVTLIYNNTSLYDTYELIDKHSQNSLYYQTPQLVALLPGDYVLNMKHIGLGGVVDNLTITPGVVVGQVFRTGKLVVNVSSYNGERASEWIPVIVVQGNDTSGEFITSGWTTRSLAFYLLPGSYTVIVPGINTTYEWYVNIGYGETRLDLNVSEANVTETYFNLGRIMVNIDLPGSPESIRSYIRIVIAEQRVVNGTPVPGRIIREEPYWHLPLTASFEVTPGIYMVYLEGSDGKPINGTLTSNIAVDPNGLAIVNYTLSILRVRLVVNNTPVPGVDIDIYRGTGDNRQYYSEITTDASGTAVIALPPGNYSLWTFVPIEDEDHLLGTVNVTGNGLVINKTLQYPGGFIVLRLLGPGGEPAANVRVQFRSLDRYSSEIIYTDMDGYAYAYLAAGTYRILVYPFLYSYTGGRIVSVAPGESVYVELHLSKVTLHVNVSGSPWLVFYIRNNTDGRLYSFAPHLYNGKTYDLWLQPGNYTIALPGSRTTIQSWNKYGYGTEYSFILGPNDHVELSFNVSEIVVMLNPCGDYDLAGSLYAYLLGYNSNLSDPYTEVIGNRYFTTYYPQAYAVFYVTPGEYAVIIPGDPWNSTWFYSKFGEFIYGSLIGYGLMDHALVGHGGEILVYQHNVSVLALHLNNTYPEGARAEYSIYTLSGSLVRSGYVSPGDYAFIPLTPGQYVLNNYGYTNITLTECNSTLVELKITGLSLKVVGPDNEPVKNAYYIIHDMNDNYVASGYTDSFGEAFISLSLGSYKLVFPGVNHSYSPYNAKYNLNKQFGYGLQLNITITGYNKLKVIFSRIDVNITSQLGKASNVEVMLYTPDMSKIIKGAYTDSNGIARFYVSSGSYRVVIRGLYYGYSDAYYVGWSYYPLFGYGAIVGDVNIGVNTSAVLHYNLSVVKLRVLDTNGNYAGGLRVVLRANDTYTTSLTYTYTSSYEPVYFYVTNGTYIIDLIFLKKTVTVGIGELADVVINVAMLHVHINIPENNYDIIPYGISITVYYNTTGTSGYSAVLYYTTNSTGDAIIYTPLNINVTVVIKKGYSITETIYMDSAKYREYNLSIFYIKVLSPTGPVKYQEFYLYTLDHSSYIRLTTDYRGEDYAIIVPGTYILQKSDWSSIIGRLDELVIIPNYTVKTYQLNLSILNIHSLVPSKYYLGNPFEFTISSIDGSYVSWSYYLYHNDTRSFYVIPGTYVIHSDISNGWDVNKTVVLPENATRDVTFKLGGLVLWIYKPDGSLLNPPIDHPYGYSMIVSLYTEVGGSLESFVSTSQTDSEGKAVFGPLVNGTYAFNLDPYDDYGGPYKLYNITAEPLVFREYNFTLGGLVVHMQYNNGTPAQGIAITIYSRSYTLYTLYTDANGTITAYLLPGTYTLYIYGLGYVYNIHVYPGRYTNKTYTTNPSDLEVSSITWTPSTPSDGDTVLVTATIKNNGPGHVFNDFNVVFYQNGTKVYEAVVHGLLSGYNTTVTAPITAIAGTDEVRVVVDPDQSIVDPNRGNNELTAWINVLRPDLEVTSVWINGTLIDGAAATLYFNVTNNGPGALHHEASVKVIYGSMVTYRRIYSLEVGEVVTLSVNIIVLGGLSNAIITVDPDNEVSESNEDNNVYNYTLSVPEPDIVVVSAALNASELVDGGIGEITAVINNTGGRTLRSIHVVLYADNKYLGTTIINGLDTGETVTVTFYVLLRGGTTNYTVIVDPYNKVPDANRSNNRATVPVYIPYPDLAFTSLYFTPTNPGSGEIVHVVFNITNIGVGGTKTNFAVELKVNGEVKSSSYISRDLYPGDTITVTLSTIVHAGNNTIEIIIDPHGYVSESNKANNKYVFIITVPYSDLEIKTMNISQGPYHNMGEVNVTVTIVNNGPGSLNETFYVAFFGNDEFLEQVEVNGLGVGEEKNITVTIPVYTGYYTIKAIVDDHYQRIIGGSYVWGHKHEVADPYRNNNIASKTIYVAGPDLTLVSAEITPSTPDPWTGFNITLRVRNNGDYASTRPVAVIVEVGSVRLIDEVPELDVGGEANVTIPVLDGLDPGTYTVRIAVNPFHEVIEHDYTDNNYTITLIIPAPDLAITHIYAPVINGSVEAGDQIIINVTVKNYGASFKRDIYIEALVNDLLIGNNYIIGGIDSGEEKNITLSLTAIPPSLENTRIIIDPRNDIYESDETNNEAIYHGPIVRSLILGQTAYDVIYMHHEEFNLKIQNNGGVPLKVTSIVFTTTSLVLNTSLPLTIKPGEIASIPILVDTLTEGIGPKNYGVIIYTNTSITINSTITVLIHNISKVISVNVNKKEAVYSMGQTDKISLLVGSQLPSIINKAHVELSGNATGIIEGSTSFNITIRHIVRIMVNATIPPGRYILLINVSFQGVDYYVVRKVDITVVRDPIVKIISPRSINSVLASNTLVVTFKSNVPINGTIYFRDVSSSSWTIIRYGELSRDTFYRIPIGGLSSGHRYMFYIEAVSEYGSYTSPMYYVNVTVSVVFVDHELNVTINRDYNQLVYVKVRNLDYMYPHAIYAKIIESSPELIVDFVGPGSIDTVEKVGSGKFVTLMLVIHAADTTRNNYTITAMLVNLDSNATDYMVIHVYVKEPVFNVTLDYLGMDNHTLVQSWRLVNHGDTITDLSVHLEGPASTFAYVYPSMNHVRIMHEQAIYFYVIPVLGIYPTDPALHNGTLVVETGDPASFRYEMPPINLPKGSKIYSVPVEHVRATGQSKDWYCTNRPHVSTKIKLSVDPPAFNNTLQINATLWIDFIPRYDVWHVLPHDGTIYVNGVPVYNWHNTIPEGTVKIPLPPKVIENAVAAGGDMYTFTVTVDTKHMNGGHYVVATNYKLQIDTGSTSIFVAASSFQDAKNSVVHLSKPNNDKVKPKECDKKVKMPGWLQALITYLKGSHKWSFENLPAPKILLDMVKSSSPIEIKAEFSIEVDPTPTSVKVSGGGSVELGVGIYGAEGKVTASGGWSVKNCKWGFDGITIELSAGGGYRWSYKFPLEWARWIPRAGDDAKPLSVEGKIYLELSSTVIQLDEHLKVKAIPTLLIGISATGKAELSVGSRLKLSAEATVGFHAGYKDYDYYAQFKAGITGNVEVDLSLFSASASGTYGLKYVYEHGSWVKKSYNDPGVTLLSYQFYNIDLGYPTLASPSTMSSLGESTAYVEGLGLYTVWVSTDNSNSKIMISRLVGDTWTTPTQLSFPNENYALVKAVPVGSKLGVLALAMPSISENTTPSELVRLLNKGTLYYAEYNGSAWTPPEIIAVNVSLSLDVESYNGLTIAAWSTLINNSYVVEAVLNDGSGWSPVTIIPGSRVPSTYTIYDVAAGFIDGRPTVYWATDLYWDGEELIRGIKYSEYNGESWTTPTTLPTTSNVALLDADTYGRIAWSTDEGNIYLAGWNGTAWVIVRIGTGFDPSILSSKNKLLVAANIRDDRDDIEIYIVDTTTWKTVTARITDDDLLDKQYTFASTPSGYLALIWRRSLDPAVKTPPENKTWASGIVYEPLYNISITGLDTTKPVVEGNPLTVTTNITNNSTKPVTGKLNIYLNESLVKTVNIMIPPNTTYTVDENITINESGKWSIKAELTDLNATSIGLLEKTITLETLRLIQNTSLTPGSYIDAVTTIHLYVNGYKKTNVTITANNLTVGSASGVIGDVAVQLNLSKLPDGPTTLVINVVTIDGAANDSLSINVYLDKTPPTIIVHEPENNTIVSGNVTVIAEIYDTYYDLPSTPEVYINGSSIMWTLVEGDNYTLIIDTTTYPDGKPLNITIIAVDVSGKTMVKTIYVTPDNTPPITTDNSTKTWYNNDVAIMLTATDNVAGVNATYYSVDNGSWVMGDIVYIPAPSDHSNDGTHTIMYYSIDNVGNIEPINTLIIGIDTLSPIITCNIANNTYFSGGTVSFFFHIVDNTSGLSKAYGYFDGSLQRIKNMNGEHEYTMDFQGLNLGYLREGMHYFRIVSVDIAGNTREYILVFYVDKTPPTAEITSPEDGALVSGTINITFNYTDNLSPVYAYLHINGETINVTGTYSYTLDTTQYNDGQLTITLEAIDYSGRRSTDTVTIIVDNTPPAVTINSPANNSVVGGIVTISYSIDEEHLDQVWLSIGNITVNITGSTTYSLNITMLPDGAYTLTITANDTLGHTSSASIIIIIDNTPPTAVITYPVSRGYYSGVINVTFNYSDTNLDKAYLGIDGSYIDVTGSYSYTLDTTQYNDGEHNITLLVKDKAGNTMEYTVTIYIDNTPPTAQILSPSNSTVIHDVVNITVMYSDIFLREAILLIDNETVNITGTYNYTLDTTTMTDGLHNITLIVQDKAGHESTTSIVVIVDNTPPTGEITSPANDTYHRGTITITVSYNDLTLEQALLIIDNETINITGLTSYTLDTTSLNDGEHIIKLVVTDKAGHAASDEITIIVDNTPPTASINSPMNGAVVSGTVTIDVSYGDANLEEARLYLDNTLVAELTGSTYQLDTTQYSDGTHTLKLVVSDKAGNTMESTITITIDNTPPVISIEAPGNNTYVKGTVTINVSYTDLTLDKAVLVINGVEHDITGETSYVLDTTTLPDGEVTITLRVTDKAGHESSQSIVLIVDNTPPTVEITSPINNAVVSGTINIAFSVEDANIEKAVLTIDGAEQVVTGKNSYTLDTTKLADGEHTITLTAIDKAGNKAEATITIIVDNTPPTITIISPLPDEAYYLGQTLTIQWSIDDANPVETILYIGEEELNVTGKTSITYKLENIPTGTLTIKIKATDAGGNTATKTVTIRVLTQTTTTQPTTTTTPGTTTPSTTPPTTTSPPPTTTTTAVIVGVIIVLLLIAGIYLLRSKKT